MGDRGSPDYRTPDGSATVPVVNTLVALDWGDVTPPPGVRSRIEARLGALRASVETIGLRKTACGYEAQVDGACGELRLRDRDLDKVVDRALDMIRLVYRPANAT